MTRDGLVGRLRGDLADGSGRLSSELVAVRWFRPSGDTSQLSLSAFS